MSGQDWKAASELTAAELEILDALEFDPALEVDPELFAESIDLGLTDDELRIRRRVDRFTDIWAFISTIVGLVGMVVFLPVSPAMSFAALVVAMGGGGYLVAGLRARHGHSTGTSKRSA